MGAHLAERKRRTNRLARLLGSLVILTCMTFAWAFGAEYDGHEIGRLPDDALLQELPQSLRHGNVKRWTVIDPGTQSADRQRLYLGDIITYRKSSPSSAANAQDSQKRYGDRGQYVMVKEGDSFGSALFKAAVSVAGLSLLAVIGFAILWMTGIISRDWWKGWKNSPHHSPSARSNTSSAEHDGFYVQAFDETQSDDYDKATWARAFAQSEGDDTKANAMYIKLRVAVLQQEERPNHLSARSSALSERLETLSDNSKHCRDFISTRFNNHLDTQGILTCKRQPASDSATMSQSDIIAKIETCRLHESFSRLASIRPDLLPCIYEASQASNDQGYPKGSWNRWIRSISDAKIIGTLNQPTRTMRYYGMVLLEAQRRCIDLSLIQPTTTPNDLPIR